MKTKRMMLSVLLTVLVCTQVAGQGFRRETFPEGSYSPVTNVNRNGCPRVLSDGSVMFRVNAPQAQLVQIDLCGTKYDMVRGGDGSWTITTKPQVPGFHYYFLIVDGVSVADPASQSSYIGLRSPEVFANVGVFSTGMFGGIQGASNFDLEKEVPGILTDTKTFNSQFDVFFMSCGEQDPRIDYTRNIVQKMRDGGVEVRFNSYPGDHEWQVWRKSLHEFAQYLFK